MSEQPLTPEAPHAVGTRANSVAVWVVLVVAGILLLLTSFAVWVNRVALNTSVFVDTSAELIRDDAIRKAVAARVVDELFDNVDVEAEIEGKLPEDLQVLSGPATAGLRQASYQVVERAFERPALQRLWAASLERSHAALVRLLEDDVPVFSTRDGVVTLDLEEIVLGAADRIGIRSQVEDKLPADVGRIEILRSDELDAAQDGFQLLKTLAWLLPVLTLAAFLLAIGLARDRRRAVRRLGFVVLVTGLVGLVAARIVGTYLVDSLVSATEVRTAAANAWGIVSEVLRASFWWFVVVGLLFVVAAWLAGPGRSAIAARRTLAPAMRDRVWPYAGLGALALIFLLTTQVNDFVGLLIVVVLLALGAIWVELTRRQTLREFPGAAGLAWLTGGRGRITGWWGQGRRAYTERRERVGRAREVARAADVAERLAKLAELHSRGELTDAEYAAAKARVLTG
ncbi:MAG TPA: SHOCT domain-containing protein, partial [Gaiellaceae bacterium]|nr:SHOCT domain-containing protein [Gaiellaceae bacterium]